MLLFYMVGGQGLEPWFYVPPLCDSDNVFVIFTVTGPLASTYQTK